MIEAGHKNIILISKFEYNLIVKRTFNFFDMFLPIFLSKIFTIQPQTVFLSPSPRF